MTIQEYIAERRRVLGLNTSNFSIEPRNLKYWNKGESEDYDTVKTIPEIVNILENDFDGNDDYFLGANIKGVEEADRGMFVIKDACLFVDLKNEMPRVLDMLERQQKALDYIAQFESHDKELNKILLKAREAREDLERMVNE